MPFRPYTIHGRYLVKKHLEQSAATRYLIGYSPSAIAATVHNINEKDCDPVLSRDEVDAILGNARELHYDGGDA